MATANKFAKYAIGNSIGAILLTFIFGPLGVLFSLLSIGLGIKGLTDYNKDNSIGGKVGAISAIIIGAILIVLYLFSRVRRLLQGLPIYPY